MKPINEMILAECIVRLHELPNRTVDDARDAKMLNLPSIFDVAVDLADRIDKLLYEQAQRHDARVDALENEINALRAKNRWIPVEERLPTKEDGYKSKYATQRTVLVMQKWGDISVATIELAKHFTHWRRIDKPDSPTPSG
jgi:hypothetical protein